MLDDGLLVRQGFVELVDGVAVWPWLVCLLDTWLLVWQGFVELVDVDEVSVLAGAVERVCDCSFLSPTTFLRFHLDLNNGLSVVSGRGELEHAAFVCSCSCRVT